MAKIVHKGEAVIEHPNRVSSASKLMRVTVVVLLLLSAFLIAVITFGGWSALAGMKAICIAWIILDVAFAYFVAKWTRGILPVIATLAMMMGVFAMIAVPSWVDREGSGYAQPALDSTVLATLTSMLVALQLLLIAAALYAFRQQWNVEIEHWPEEEGAALAAGA
jgi:uncharacterized membrane protein